MPTFAGAPKPAALLLVCVGLLLATSVAIAAPKPPKPDKDDEGTCGAPSDAAAAGEFFPDVGAIVYKGPESRDPLSFRYYNGNEVICVKDDCRTMSAWLRFSVSFWHTFRGDGSDPFGSPTKRWPWDASDDPMENAKRAMRANFEFLNKLGVEYWCFHDRDIAPEGASVEESEANLIEIAAVAKALNAKHSKKILWATAQLFKHPRYMHGAATSPSAQVFAYAAAQVKATMDVAASLGASGFVFWGGREGYSSLLNTDMALEQENMALFLRLASQYKHKIGFRGKLFLEPKPQEPTKHQYDWDAATTSNFLQRHGLADAFELNIECNHATLSGHSCEHELQTASMLDLLGSVDVNSGDPQVGWDTDQFPSDVAEATRLMLVVLRQGGLSHGGLNFDAKLRRESTAVEDIFFAHIAGMDTMARGLRAAARILNEGELDALVSNRYSSWKEGIFLAKEKLSLEGLAEHARSIPEPLDTLESGHQEKSEIMMAWYT